MSRQPGPGLPSAKCEAEVFAKWLTKVSKIHDDATGKTLVDEAMMAIKEKLKQPWADLKWNENGPLLTYADVTEQKHKRDYTKYLFAAKGVYKLTKFSLKGTWVATKMAGKIAVGCNNWPAILRSASNTLR